MYYFLSSSVQGKLLFRKEVDLKIHHCISLSHIYTQSIDSRVMELHYLISRDFLWILQNKKASKSNF
jgi:hypothetical protein